MSIGHDNLCQLVVYTYMRTCDLKLELTASNGVLKHWTSVCGHIHVLLVCCISSEIIVDHVYPCLSFGSFLWYDHV